MNTQFYLDKAVTLFVETLKENLVGIYVHGSLAMGCFNPDRSVDFNYPTPFEFHYSNFHTDKYETDENYLCGGFDDEDLASQIVIAYERGLTLWGSPMRELYKPIDTRYYILSILHDVEGSREEIINNPVYCSLNLCRVLFFLKEGKVSSKKEGGEWGLNILPHNYLGLVQQCLAEYAGSKEKYEYDYDKHQLIEFADYMLREIQINK